MAETAREQSLRNERDRLSDLALVLVVALRNLSDAMRDAPTPPGHVARALYQARIALDVADGKRPASAAQ